jgi:hypothetical protein
LPPPALWPALFARCTANILLGSLRVLLSLPEGFDCVPPQPVCCLPKRLDCVQAVVVHAVAVQGLSERVEHVQLLPLQRGLPERLDPLHPQLLHCLPIWLEGVQAVAWYDLPERFDLLLRVWRMQGVGHRAAQDAVQGFMMLQNKALQGL